MNPLIKQVKYFIDSHQLIARGDTILVGVSGGPDSISLLLILNELHSAYGCKLKAAHFNHNLRRDSSKDQKCVEDLCRTLNIPLTIGEWKHSTKITGSIEAKAREKRLTFFISTLKEIHADKIALGHTQDDLAETVLMRLLRGTGLQGLRSILPERELYSATVIRPLLNTSKKEILNFLQKNRVRYCLDSTNNKDFFFRNKIRRNLIPLLEKEYSANIKGLLVSLAQQSALDYDYLDKNVNEVLKTLIVKKERDTIDFSLKKLKNLSQSPQNMALRKAIQLLKGDTNRLTSAHSALINEMIARQPTGSCVELPGNIFLKKTARNIRLTRRKACI